MKIAIFSDLHCEFGQTICISAAGADVIVLAGDCEKGEESIKFASHLRKQYRVPVVMVGGNHEFYGSDYHHMLPSLRKLAKAEEVHFLENDCVIVNDVRFIGCTMWTNFSLHGLSKQKEYMKEAGNRISDFHRIKFAGERFQPIHALGLFEASYEWMSKILDQPFAGKTVVITHFAPHMLAKHPKYPVDDPFRPYFISDCTQLMESHSIDLWIFGHTHYSVDFVLENGIHLVSNQFGYPGEDPRYTRFDPEKIVEI